MMVETFFKYASSTNVTYFLLVVYAYIAVASIYEQNWNRLEYWTGALLIVHSTLWGAR